MNKNKRWKSQTRTKSPSRRFSSVALIPVSEKKQIKYF
jgi:hypothetical protein